MPVGSTQPVKVDARIIAATHRNLEHDVPRAAFARTCTTASTVFRSRCRRCATGVATSPAGSHFLRKYSQRLGKTLSDLDAVPSRASRPTIGGQRASARERDPSRSVLAGDGEPHRRAAGEEVAASRTSRIRAARSRCDGAPGAQYIRRVLPSTATTAPDGARLGSAARRSREAARLGLVERRGRAAQ